MRWCLGSRLVAHFQPERPGATLGRPRSPLDSTPPPTFVPTACVQRGAWLSAGGRPPPAFPCGPWPRTLSAILMKRLQPSQEASRSRPATLSHTSRTRVLVPTSSIWAERRPMNVSGRGSAWMTLCGLSRLPAGAGRGLSREGQDFPSRNWPGVRAVWSQGSVPRGPKRPSLLNLL